MLETMYTCEVVLKNCTGNWGIGGNHWEIEGIRGKFKGNSGEIGELCFPNGETEFTGGEINFPMSGKKEEMRGNSFTKIPIWRICVKQLGEM